MIWWILLYLFIGIHSCINAEYLARAMGSRVIDTKVKATILAVCWSYFLLVFIYDLIGKRSIIHILRAAMIIYMPFYMIFMHHKFDEDYEA